MPSGIRAASGGNILALTLTEIWYVVPAGIFAVILMCLPQLGVNSYATMIASQSSYFDLSRGAGRATWHIIAFASQIL